MPRPIAGDLPAASVSPYQTPPNGLPQPVPATPFNYTNQPTLPAPAVKATPTAAGLWNAFRRRWVLGTFIGGLVAATVAVALWTMMPAGKHQVRAIVQLRSRNIDPVNAKNQEDFEAYRRHQMFLLKTRDLLTRTVADPAVASLQTIKESEDPVTMLEEQIKVTVAAPEVLEVTMTGNNIEDMKVILDNLVQKYVDDATREDREERDRQLKKLETTAETLRLEIEALERQIELEAKQSGALGGQDDATQLAILKQQHLEASRKFDLLSGEVSTLEAQLKVAKELNEKAQSFVPDKAIIDPRVALDPRVIKARDAVKLAQGQLDKDLEIIGKDGDQNIPLIIEQKKLVERLKTEAVSVEKAVETEIVGIVKANEIVNRKLRVSQFEESLQVKVIERDNAKVTRDQYKRQIESTAGGGASVAMRRAALQPQRDQLEKVNAVVTQLRVSRDLDGRVKPRGTADGILNNNLNKKVALSGVGGLVAFLGVLLLVSYLEWRTRRVDGVDSVVNELGMRVIGTVPLFPNRANVNAAIEAGGANWRFVLNESINSTRTMLLHTARTQSMQVVMVTSATQGEGKTSLASQLATSMATAGMRTLVVDCDLRNPSIQKLFELPLGPGVSEVLRQELDVSDAVQATDVPNLWVITAGQCSNATIAALAQGHPLETLFNRLRGQFDFVIVDSCPVLPVADALLIAQHVDGVVFSIMQDISQLPKVITASEKLTQLNIPLVGAVVNGIKQDTYSYGYNYVKQLPG